MTDQDKRDNSNSLIERFRKRSRDRRELYPGITRGDAFLYGGGVLVYTLVICSLSFLIISIQNSRSAQDAADIASVEMQQATLTAVYNAGLTQEAEIEAQATQAIIQATETAIAQITPTPRSVFGQLQQAAQPTPTPTVETAATLPPPPADLSGVIVGWGGNNPSSSELLNLRLYNPAAPDDITDLEQDFVRLVSSDNTLERVMYFGFEARANDDFIYTYDTTAPQDERVTLLEQRWSGEGGLIEPVYPVMSRNGRFMAFIAGFVGNNRSQEVYRYDFEQDQLLRLTNDEFAYAGLAISDDGSRLVGVQEQEDGSERDLVLLEAPLEVPEGVPDLVSATTVQTLTDDGNEFSEAMPAFSPDGTQIVYTVTTPDQPENHDIYLLTILADGSGAASTPLFSSPDDEIYPTFSPDGRYIAFASDAPGDYDIYIENIRSTERFQLTRTDDEPDFPGAWVTGEATPPTPTPGAESE